MRAVVYSYRFLLSASSGFHASMCCSFQLNVVEMAQPASSSRLNVLDFQSSTVQDGGTEHRRRSGTSLLVVRLTSAVLGLFAG